MRGTTPAAETCIVTKISKMLSGWAESRIILFVGIIQGDSKRWTQFCKSIFQN